jgi:hypothetical protein
MASDTLFHEAECIDCQAVVLFPGLPSDATCPQRGLSMYVTADSEVGRYPGPDSFSWGLQRRRPTDR